jgi:hypothetical protein
MKTLLRGRKRSRKQISPRSAFQILGGFPQAQDSNSMEKDEAEARKQPKLEL